jgi:glycosyltransferase involved in cell wall biosynthesis
VVAVSFRTDVTAVIPHIPVRVNRLPTALGSVLAQTWPVSALSVAVDLKREGSATTRTRALLAAQTHWVAFLDDDDEWLPNHLEVLLDVTRTSGADVVYSNCEVRGDDGQVTWKSFGQPFDAKLLFVRPYMTVVSLVRAELARAARFDADWDEWGFYRRLHRLGATFQHTPEITWVWNSGSHGTSGQSDRW